MKVGDLVTFPHGAWGPGYRIERGRRGRIHSIEADWYGNDYMVKVEDSDRIIQAHRSEIEPVSVLDLLAEV